MAEDDEKKPETQEYKFDPNEHLMQLKSKEGAKDYLPVQWRLVWFRNDHTEGTIETEMLLLDLEKELEKEGFAWNNDTRRSEKVLKKAKGIAVFRAVVKNSTGGVGTGHGSESAADFDDFIEKAETKAIGRALAALGYGTQFAPELDEQHRIVDAPVDRGNTAGAAPTPPVLGGDEQKDEERNPSATVRTASKPPTVAPQKTPTTPPPVKIEEVALDATMISEKARMVIVRLFEELGPFELREFLKFLNLRPDQNLYDPMLWNGPTGEELIQRVVKNLGLWLKPHTIRTKWMNQPVLAEQLKAILNPLPEPPPGTVYDKEHKRPASHFKAAYLANKESIQSILIELIIGEFEESETDTAYEVAHMKATRQMGRIRDMDATMHGKQMKTFTAGEADRYLTYFDTKKSLFQNGEMQVEIPEEFLYKEPPKVVAA